MTSTLRSPASIYSPRSRDRGNASGRRAPSASTRPASTGLNEQACRECLTTPGLESLASEGPWLGKLGSRDCSLDHRQAVGRRRDQIHGAAVGAHPLRWEVRFLAGASVPPNGAAAAGGCTPWPGRIAAETELPLRTPGVRQRPTIDLSIGGTSGPCSTNGAHHGRRHRRNTKPVPPIRHQTAGPDTLRPPMRRGGAV